MVITFSVVITFSGDTVVHDCEYDRVFVSGLHVGPCSYTTTIHHVVLNKIYTFKTLERPGGVFWTPIGFSDLKFEAFK